MHLGDGLPHPRHAHKAFSYRSTSGEAGGDEAQQNGAMADPIDALAAQQRELAALVTDADAAQLRAPSRCDGWTVADVLLHLAQTNELAVASTEGRLVEWVQEQAPELPAVGSVDELAGVLVDLQRGEPEASRDRWVASADAQLRAFEAVDPDARLTWVAGELAARTLATTRLTETWIHTVDVAGAFGPVPPATDRLWHTARLVWRTVPYALSQQGLDASGPVAFDLVGPGGDAWQFGDLEAATTTIAGSALELCTVAGQRGDAADTDLVGTGPDAAAVLAHMRTFA